MRQQWYKFLSVVLLIVLLSVSQAFAGNGKITGNVKGADGAAVVGANVQVEGTALGGAADVNGNFFVLNVPPGTYRVRASAVGFAPKVVAGVRVGSDQIVTLAFSLQTEAVGMAEVVVQADRPIVDKSQTSAKTRLSGDDFQSLPIRDVRELVNTSASVYKGFIRGGKVFETKTLIDGVDVTDQFAAWISDVPGGTTPYLTYNGIIRQDQGSKSSLVDLNVNSVEEANVLTGGIGADYSSASAGVIAYSLREGRGKWNGRADVRVSQLGGLYHNGPGIYADDTLYFQTKATLAASTVAVNREKGARFTYTRDKYSYGAKPEIRMDAGFGGGMGDNAGAYFTLGYLDSHGRLPAEFTRRVNASAKLNYNFSSDIHLNFTGMLEDRGRLFGWKNRTYAEDFRYFLEGVPKWDGSNILGTLKLTHVLSKSTFYEIQASMVDDISRRGYVDGNNDGQIGLYETGDFLTFADTSQVNRYMAVNSGTEFQKFFSPSPRNEAGSETTTLMSGASNWKIARPGIFYENFRNTVYTLKADMTSQITANHQLRGGLQARFHNLDRTLRAGYIGGVFSNYRNYVEEVWNVRPKEYSGYLQDRMEYAGLIINLGFRLDALNLASSDYANYFAPFADVIDANGGTVRVPVRGERRVVYINGKATDIIDPETNSTKIKVLFSPRIGVSHPISERAAMYFSFSQQQQSQPFSRLFTNYNDFGNPSLPVVTKADQDPIKSTNYDFGIQWSFMDDYGLDVNAYYKDILNYSPFGFTIVPAAPYRLYNISTVYGYADSRGVEFTVRKNITPVTDFLSVGGRISYAYSYIKASAYAGGATTTFSTAAGDSARYSGNLPWDNIKFYNSIERNVLGANSTLTGGYDRTHRIAYNLFLRFPYEVTLSSVGTFASGFYYPLTLGDPRARELGVGPWTKRVDLRLEKGFLLEGLGRIAIYADVVNAFNWTNIVAYNNSNVGQIEWERNGDPTGGPTINRPIGQDGSLFYDNPREVYFGVNIMF